MLLLVQKLLIRNWCNLIVICIMISDRPSSLRCYGTELWWTV